MKTFPKEKRRLVDRAGESCWEKQFLQKPSTFQSGSQTKPRQTLLKSIDWGWPNIFSMHQFPQNDFSFQNNVNFVVTISWVTFSGLNQSWQDFESSGISHPFLEGDPGERQGGRWRCVPTVGRGDWEEGRGVCGWMCLRKGDLFDSSVVRIKKNYWVVGRGAWKRVLLRQSRLFGGGRRDGLCCCWQQGMWTTNVQMEEVILTHRKTKARDGFDPDRD